MDDACREQDQPDKADMAEVAGHLVGDVAGTAAADAQAPEIVVGETAERRIIQIRDAVG